MRKEVEYERNMVYNAIEAIFAAKATQDETGVTRPEIEKYTKLDVKPVGAALAWLQRHGLASPIGRREWVPHTIVHSAFCWTHGYSKDIHGVCKKCKTTKRGYNKKKIKEQIGYVQNPYEQFDWCI